MQIRRRRKSMRRNMEMKKRIAVKTAGAILLFLSLAVEGMMIGRVQGSAPVYVITLGDVSAVLTGPEHAGTEEPTEPVTVIENPRPGQIICQEPTVCMGEDSAPAYLRARILVSGMSEQQAEEIRLGLEQPEGWHYNFEDGYYYYKNAVSSKEKIPVFQRIHIPVHWKKTDRLQINVTVEAVEASSLTPRVDAECRLTGWITDGDFAEGRGGNR